jgi:hypothetical protein
MIHSCVATETWAQNGGGEADIHPLKPGLLVIAHMRAIHDEIRALMMTIRNMRQRPPHKNGEATEAMP